MSELRTDRLSIRVPRPDDAVALAERRSHPEVARHQDWSTPFPLDAATRIVGAVADAAEPVPDEWFMYTVVATDDDAIVGDLALLLTQSGRCAEIGYSLHPDHWGNGFAVEAVDALVDHLIDDRGVGRVGASVVPENTRSARVLERCGFLFEGHTRRSYWDERGFTDDWIYGLTPEDRDAWRTRPRSAAAVVQLVEITPDNAREVVRLRTHHSQTRFVATVQKSFADALVPEVIDGAAVVPWYRAVVADDELVGFVMVAEITEAHPEPYLWRLLVDRRHQRRGVGTRILDLVVEQCRTWGATSLLTSWDEGLGSPRAVYERYGFVETGAIVEDETEGRLVFGVADHSHGTPDPAP